MTASSDDEGMARRLLSGWGELNTRGLMVSKYYRSGSAEETEARKAMARFLKSDRPLRQDFRDMLAVCFDPDCTPFPVARRIEMRKPSRGADISHAANTTIAQEVWDRWKSGRSVGAAIEEVAEKYGFRDTSSVQKIWRRYRKLLRAIYDQGE